MYRLLAAMLLVAGSSCPVAHAGEDRSPPARPANPQPAKTGKERLSDKGSDEQRVDDCKVPKERRTRERSVSCPWDVGS